MPTLILMAHLKGFVRILLFFTVVFVVFAVVSGGLEICLLFFAAGWLILLFFGSPAYVERLSVDVVSAYSPQAPRAPPLF